MSDVERRFVELRQEGRRLSGVAILYRAEAKILSFRERFEPGAFGNVGGLDVILNRQHRRDAPLARTGGGGLDLTDSAESLRISADLAETRDANDVLKLVEAKILRGLSLEFRAIKETWTGDLRTISKATLSGIGVVDSAAYSDSTVSLATRNKLAHTEETPQEEVMLWL